MAAAGNRFGILVGGGPAPGINSAISSATIEAVNNGFEVIGIEEGFENLIAGHIDRARPLRLDEVTRIHSQGGSILGTARANPTKSEADLRRTVESLRALGIGYLVTIGGDDTAFAAFEVARAAGGDLRVAHVPKTIDNDLPLPGGNSTFGYQTARHVGTDLVLNIMEDSRTTNRWFIVVVMGRKAGHLALGIGKAAGATLSLIPEEFPANRITLDDVARVIDAAILKRRIQGRRHGVAVVAEGVAEKIDPAELEQLSGMEIARDPYGHIALGDIPIGALIKQRVQRRFAARGERLPLVEVSLGYELRCARPIPFDIDYTRTLGYGAVKFLLAPPAEPALASGGFVCHEGGRLMVLPFDDLRDPQTGRTRVRLVDTQSEHYRVARDYMIRLEAEDLADETTVARLAAAANLSVEAFRAEFAPAVTLAPSLAASR